MFARRRILLVVVNVAMLGIFVSACSNDDASIEVSHLQLVKANVVVRVAYYTHHYTESGGWNEREEYDFVCNEYNGISHHKQVTIYEYLSGPTPGGNIPGWSPSVVSHAMKANGYSSNTTITFIGHEFSTFAPGQNNDNTPFYAETGPNVFIVASLSSS